MTRNGRFRWQVFAIALALSLIFHGVYVVPQMLAPLTEKPEVPLEVAYVPDPSATGTDEKDTPDPNDKDEKKKVDDDDKLKPLDAKQEKEKKKKLAENTPAPEPEKIEPPKPKPVVAQPVPPPPPQQPPPPPPPPIDHRMQMVDQDKFPDEADNKDAHFLGQKNHKTEKETRAENTNLIREVESPNKNSSSENDNKSDQVGHKDEKIAELENHQGPDKSMPRSSPMQGEEGTKADHSPQKPGPLSMRDLTPRSSVKARDGQREREGVEVQESESGNLPMARIGRDAERGHAAQKGGQHVKLSLDHHQYDAIEGYDTAEKERRQAAKAESSHHQGRYERYLAKAQAVRSSIENFTPEVKPGNQSELGTRASPFAAYITAMHRQIHKLWTFGFLSDIDLRQQKNDQFANMELWTQLEIVLKSDGTVDRVGIVRSSGVLPFDVAAIDSVMSAAPFPVPPSVIRSANGKVYMDWQFHRDERACGTFGVDPYILTTPGDNATHDTSETGAGAKEMYKAARAGKLPPGVANATQPQAHPETAEREAPRTLKREPHEDDAIPSVRPSAPATVTVPEVTAEARAAAEGWLAAYARGDAGWLAGWSATPFTAAGEVVAKDSPKLKAMYKQLLAEAPEKRKVEQLEVFTPAGIRGKLGGLPPGGEDDDMLFAVGKAGGEEFILLLKHAPAGWRVCGLDR